MSGKKIFFFHFAYKLSHYWVSWWYQTKNLLEQLAGERTLYLFLKCFWEFYFILKETLNVSLRNVEWISLVSLFTFSLKSTLLEVLQQLITLSLSAGDRNLRFVFAWWWWRRWRWIWVSFMAKMKSDASCIIFRSIV